MAAMDRNVLDAQVRASVNQKLEESGEKEKLKELLRKKLIERGWRDELKDFCKEVIKSKGLEQISVEDLVAEITPRGRATIPDDIKAELLERIRKFLATADPLEIPEGGPPAARRARPRAGGGLGGGADGALVRSGALGRARLSVRTPPENVWSSRDP
eukprot:CAMPEP_0180184664 /NCGR_PEP_ID=MMETSP0986-20121125/41948_1 /TAXON_ID=697907 /ORGANISM="non described non described, Strain CCMP2293" /LENGTH=157 /DNA_ID=CAMNT_0022138371 /DNA_START=526 /DNA_END=1001 /DNA_ORIENTATION=+